MNSYIILFIIAAYFAVLLLIAWITGRNNSNEAFFLGDRKSPWYIVSIGMVGTSLSGVTFVSVPGMVRAIDMTYMQTVLGFFVGYIIIAKVLLPLYYKLQLTSIYSYLDDRIGRRGYKTGASFFLLSKIVGAAARLYLVVLILQTYVFNAWNIPFAVTAILSILLVWLYTFRSGIKTIIWTDTLQALCLVAMLIVIIWQVKDKMGLDFGDMAQTLVESPHFRIFEFGDWHSTQNFFKQFFSGIFITIVMTGLDQDMMQKNLSCKSLKDAQKNMYTYGFAFTPVNFLFLALGVLLLTLAAQQNIQLPTLNDDILPMFCTSGILGGSILIFFTIGIIAAAFSSADSALTALTTSFCVDILGVQREEAKRAKRTRLKVHVMISVLFVLIILAFKAVNNRSVIDAIYMIASYTYGPLLGLFVFGLFTKRKPRDKYVPYICIASPLICLATDFLVKQYVGYTFGYEMLMVNGGITFAGLSFDQRFNVVSLPFLFSSTEEADAALDGAGGEALGEILESTYNVHLLGIAENGFRHITNSKHAIASKADMNGLKMRVAGSQLLNRSYELWGADYTNANWSEVFTALQTGTYDGQENPLPTADAASIQEVQSYLTYWTGAYDCLFFCMNAELYNSLSPELQAIVDEAGQAACEYERELNRSQDQEIMDKWAEAGVEITESRRVWMPVPM